MYNASLRQQVLLKEFLKKFQKCMTKVVLQYKASLITAKQEI